VISPGKCKQQLKIRGATQARKVLAEYRPKTALDLVRAVGKVSFTEFLDSHHPFLSRLPLDSIPVDNPPIEIGERFMRDVLFVFVTVLFFFAGILYLRGCERLR